MMPPRAMFLLLLLLLGVQGSRADTPPDQCATTEMYNWIKDASIPSLAAETLADWSGPEPCAWTGVTCEEGCFKGLNLTDFGLSVFEDPTCDAFSLACDYFSDPKDPTWAPCFQQGSQECFDAIDGGVVNGFAIANRPFEKILLGGNTLYGTWPSIPEFKSLVDLDLSNHILERDFHLLTVYEDKTGEAGPPPYESLRSYKCDGCNLVGTIPADLDFGLKAVWGERYPKLQELSLSGSKMVGALPEGWGNWSSLRSLDLSSNDLTGAIPASWGDLSDIEFVDLSGNDQLSPELPQAWEERMTCSKDEPLKCRKK